MKKIDLDIFVFENIIPDDLCFKLSNIRINANHTGRIDLLESDKDTFIYFNKFWMNNIENIYLDEYFQNYNVEKNIGLNVSYDVINQLKEFNKTRWRDMFLLYYDKNTNNKGSFHLHWDFSGLTMVCCLDDNYGGGELVFPRQKVSYKLNKKDIIIFPGGLTHPHYASQVTSGVRNVLVGQSMTLLQNHSLTYE